MTDKSQQQLLEEYLNEWSKGAGITVRTSGSTGTPKQIVLPPEQIRRSARRTNRFFGITKRSRLHTGMSFEFIGGKMMIARSIESGCKLTFSEPKIELQLPDDPDEITLMCVVPAQMAYILENLDKFSNVKNFLVGGSAIDDRMWDRIVASKVTAWESYGMTETATHVAIRRIAGSSGKRPRFVPLPGAEINLAEDDSILIKDGDVFVATTDMGRMAVDGSFEIIGRKDDVIITGGIKVIPQEVEKVVQDAVNPYCKEFIISSEPDEIWTSKLILLVAAEKSPENEEELKSKIKRAIDAIPEETLPRMKRPKAIKIVESLPRTASGKIKRKP
ncbi:MAG: AMP-binding protein [Muribaculaceae bacterium]|nr:AMP-binding protein [Muribaculaceae bacterium]